MRVLRIQLVAHRQSFIARLAVRLQTKNMLIESARIENDYDSFVLIRYSSNGIH